MDLLRVVEGIAAKMQSKELQDMKMNQLISQTVINTKSITVEHSLTEAGKMVQTLLN